jgi:hypothetical protein
MAYDFITEIYYFSEDSYYGIHIGNMIFYAKSEDDYPTSNVPDNSDDSGAET